MMRTIFIRQVYCLFLIYLIVFGACSSDRDKKHYSHEDISTLYPVTELNGWDLNETNTGLCGDYTGLTPIDTSDVGIVLRGVLYVNVPGITISYKEINYPILIGACNVTFDHCLIKPPVCGYGVPVVNMEAQVTGVIIRDTEVDCNDIPIEDVGFSLIVNGDNLYLHREMQSSWWLVRHIYRQHVRFSSFSGTGQLCSRAQVVYRS